MPFWIWGRWLIDAVDDDEKEEISVAPSRALNKLMHSLLISFVSFVVLESIVFI